MKRGDSYVPPAALAGSMRDFRVPQGDNLLTRVGGFYRWQDLRRQNGLWPFSRSTEEGPTAVCAARDDQGNRMQGVNFASQDYLSLSSHPMALLRPHLDAQRIKGSRELRDTRHGRGVHVAGLVTQRQRPATAKGTIFVTLEDEHGMINVIVWPDLAARQRKPLLDSTLDCRFTTR